MAEVQEVQFAYAIGIAKPVSAHVDTFGTTKVDEAKIERIVPELFDLRPKGIIQMLNLLRSIYRKTGTNGHFGRDEPEFTWKKTDKAEALRLEDVPAAAQRPASEKVLNSRRSPWNHRYKTFNFQKLNCLSILSTIEALIVKYRRKLEKFPDSRGEGCFR